VASVIPSAPLGTDAAAGRPGLGAAEGAGPFGAAAERRFRFELAAHPGSPAQARRLARARLTGWSVCEDTCDTAALVISELVTNAVVHTASTRVVCELHDHDDLVRIAVRDEGCAPGEPHPSPRRPDEEHGRGLLLIGALCRAWGAQESGTGLLVWAELPRGADTGDPVDPVDSDSSDDSEDSEASESTGHVYGLGPASGTGGVRGDLGWGPRPKPTPSGGPGEPDGPERPEGPGVPDQAGRAGVSGTAGVSRLPGGPRTGEVLGRGADRAPVPVVAAAPGAEAETAGRRNRVGEVFRQGAGRLRHYGPGVGRPRGAGTERG
jgi:anti-sigma regulatory factor (Ser/Thr protein kinase)